MQLQCQRTAMIGTMISDGFGYPADTTKDDKTNKYGC